MVIRVHKVIEDDKQEVDSIDPNYYSNLEPYSSFIVTEIKKSKEEVLKDSMRMVI